MGTTYLGKWLRKTRIHSTPSPSHSSDCVTTVVSDLELEESNDVLATRADSSPHQAPLSAAPQSHTTPPLKPHPKPQQPNDSSASTHPNDRTNKHGLILIHQPATDLSATAPETQYPIDIVAVHGIMGDSYTTWTHPNGHFWLRDSLPGMFPGARIYSYGYPARMFSRELGGIGDHAALLLEELRDQRRGVEEQKRPIIFICHSMGGIVVKKAINITVVDHTRFINIRSSTAAIFFLATPHCGSDPAKLLSVVADIMNVPLVGGGMARFSGKLRADQIKALAPGSKTLLDISNDFREHPGNMKIYSFIEQNSTPPSSGKIVDDISGRMFVPGEVWVPMPGCNHREVARFESKESLGYNQILKKLSEVAEELTTKMSAELSAEDIPCLHSLSFPAMSSRLQETTSQAHPQTCPWILTHPTFKTWTSSSGLLWIKGHPGTGKSTLMAFLYRYFQTQPIQHKNIFPCFFFHGNGTPMQKSQLGMFRSLLHQLYKQNSSARRTILRVFNEKKETIGEQEEGLVWGLEELRALFQDTVLSEALTQNDVTILVDALDEATDEGGAKAAQSLLGYFHQLNEAIVLRGGRTKICISCRTYPVVAVSGGLQISIQDENRRDIERHVDGQLRIGVEGWGLQPERVRWELEKAIVDKADGVFLWACRRVPRIIEDLNDGSASFEDVRKLLETESNELYAMYEDILAREIKTSLREKALLFMQWICLAERPLSLTEIRIAMACDESCMKPEQDRIEDSKDFVESDARMEKLIRSLSGGLAEVRHGSTVQLFHQTVTDFLRERGIKTLFAGTISSSITGWTDEQILGISQDRLSKSCFQYLELGEVARIPLWASGVLVQKREEIEEQFPFIRYATTFAFVHAERAEAFGIPHAYLVELLEPPTRPQDDGVIRHNPEELIGYSSNMFETWKVLFKDIDRTEWRYPGVGSSLVHVAACFNLQSVVHHIAEQGGSIQQRDYDEITPLHYAIRLGYEQMTIMLLEHGADVEARTKTGITPLGYAVANGQEKIARLLLRRGANVNTGAGQFGSILEAACNVKGSMALVADLVDYGATINCQVETTSTALQEAAYGGNIEMVRYMISKGADVNARGSYYGTALHAAVQARDPQREHITRLLLDKKADVNAQGGEYGSPLQAAAHIPGRENKHILMMLLDEGADVNAQGGEYGTALQAACTTSSVDSVKVLLAMQADVNIRGGKYGTALQAAARCNNDVVPLLLSHGADVNAQGGHYGSALQAAATTHDPDIVRLLLERGARADMKGGVHGNMLQAAAWGGNEEIATIFLERGADINELGGEFGSALQAAVPFCPERFIKFLLDRGADVNLQGGGEGNALRAALKWPRESIIKLLLESGADIQFGEPGKYESAFQLALGRGDPKIINLLLDHGKNVNPKDLWYKEALERAKTPGKERIRELLLQWKVRAELSSNLTVGNSGGSE